MHIRVVDEDDDHVYLYDEKGRRLGRVKWIVLEDGRALDPRKIYTVR